MKQQICSLRAVIMDKQNREAHQCGERNSKGITRPCGAATPRNSDAHERIAVPQALCDFGSTPDQDPKAAKFAVLTPGHAGFPNRAKRSEGSDTTPIRNTPVSACKPLCARLGAGVACVPAFTCESEREPFVRV